MKRRAVGLIVWGGLWVAAFGQEVWAGLVTYRFEGVVDSVGVTGTRSAPGGIVAGATFRGSFTYDDATPNTGGSAVQGSYENALVEFRVEIGPNSLTLDDVLTMYANPQQNILVDDDNPAPGGGQVQDAFQASLQSVTDAQNAFYERLVLQTVGSPPLSAVNTIDLASLTLDLAAFVQKRWYVVSYEPDGEISVESTLTSLTLQPVPEPSTLLSLLGGAVALGVRRIKRRTA